MASTRAYVATENTPLACGAAIRFCSVRVKDADCYPAAENAPCGETLTVLDGRGRPYRSLDYDRAGTDVGGSGVARATTTWLNPLGWLTKVSDPRGSVWTYAYDSFGNRTQSKDPDLGAWTMAYDASRNLLEQTDAKSQAITFQYDLLDRRTKKVAGGVTFTSGYDTARLKATAGGATTLTIGPIEARNFKVPGGETLILYPAPWFRVTGGTTSVLRRDQVASIQAITGGGGGVVKETTYQPFGEARDATGVENPISPSESHGYIGERYDAGPELQFLNARYYD
ncbi:MAG: hypothetical protein DI556_21775, partial [Rhodovulum sulfidophilum]